MDRKKKQKLTDVSENSDTHDVQFETELDKRYQCPVCLGALCSPLQTRCGHRFCAICLRESTGWARYGKCPVDKTVLNIYRDTFPDVATEREVLSLTVLCDNVNEGCTWKGDLRNFKQHMKSCPEAVVDCTNQPCKEKMRRRALEDHLISDCMHREAECSHCQIRMVAANVPKHQVLGCAKFPVNCATCGETGLLREDALLHMHPVVGDCPLAVIKCQFFDIGCFFQDKRKNMDEHYELADKHHMMLLYNQTSYRLMELHDDNCQLRLHLQSLQSKTNCNPSCCDEEV